MKERLSIREKARRRDGNAAWLFPQRGHFWHGRVLTDGTELWYVRVRPRG